MLTASLGLNDDGGTGLVVFPSLPSPLFKYRADVATPGATFTWTDQVGTAGNAVQASAAAQPTIVAASANFNGKPSLSWNGTTQFLATAVGFSRAQPVTFYAILKCTNIGGNVAVVDFHTNVGPLIGNTANDWYMRVSASVTSANTTAAACVICAVFNDSVTSAIYINNSTTAVATGSAGAAGIVADTLGIGCLTNLGNQFFGGEMTDIVGYGAAHAQTDRAAFFAYAAARYGIAAA